MKRADPSLFDSRRDVGPELLERIVKEATQCPSLFNLQPWRFVIVQSPRNRDKLTRLLPGCLPWRDAPVFVLILAFVNPHLATLNTILAGQVDREILSSDEARGQRIVIRRTLENHPDRTSWAIRSAAMAARGMMLAAERFGLASAVLEVHSGEKLRQSFGVPDDHEVGNVIALGYAVHPPPDPGRLPLESVVYAEHFGQPWNSDEK